MENQWQESKSFTELQVWKSSRFLPFSFQLRGGDGAKVSTLNPNPGLSDARGLHLAAHKVRYLRYRWGEVDTTSALAPKRGPLGLSPKTSWWWHCPGRKWLESLDYSELEQSEKPCPNEVMSSPLRLVIKALKEPKDRQKQNIKHSGNATFDEIVSTAIKCSISL